LHGAGPSWFRPSLRYTHASIMEILLEPSEYRFLNAGDSAMMQVAMSRLCSMWPEAEIRILTSHPELLPAYSPRVSPLANTGRLLWLGENLFPLPLARRRCKLWSRSLSVHHPKIAGRLRELRYARHGTPDGQMVDEFLRVAGKTSAFVVAGMGGLTSAFPDYTVMMLDTLALAQALKVPTVLFGQGIGPFDGQGPNGMGEYFSRRRVPRAVSATRFRCGSPRAVAHEGRC
jgi:polysaccharide pyruvyl transferase WcaK-like protein